MIVLIVILGLRSGALGQCLGLQLDESKVPFQRIIGPGDFSNNPIEAFEWPKGRG